MSIKLKGIDLSYFDGEPISAAAWKDIKSKCDFVILRFGYRGYSSGALKIDSQFKNNLAAVKKYGIPFGLYFFTQAMSKAEAEEEADLIAANIDLTSFDYPVFCDSEYSNSGKGRADKLSKAERTAANKAFMDRIIQLGGKAGLYAGYYWLKEHLNQSELTAYDLWCPCYQSTCLYTGSNLVMWQFSSTNALGINGIRAKAVDCNYCYKDYVGGTNTTSNTTTTAESEEHNMDTLRNGDKGQQVAALQKLLNNEANAGLVVDGIFGAKTRAAVKAYQKAKGLTVDGIVGVNTWGKLLEA